MLETVFTLTLVMLALACLLTLWRVVRGPTLPDRVVALDLLGVTIVGIAVAEPPRDTGSGRASAARATAAVVHVEPRSMPRWYPGRGGGVGSVPMS